MSCTYLDRHCMLIMRAVSSGIGGWLTACCLSLAKVSLLAEGLGGAVLREGWKRILPDSLTVTLRWNCNIVRCVCKHGAVICQPCVWLLWFRYTPRWGQFLTATPIVERNRQNCNTFWCVCRCGALNCQPCAWLLFRALANKTCTIRNVWCRRVWGAVRWQEHVGNTFGKLLVSFLIKYVAMLIGISKFLLFPI